MYKDNNYILSLGRSKTRGMAIKRLIMRCHSTGGKGFTSKHKSKSKGGDSENAAPWRLNGNGVIYKLNLDSIQTAFSENIGANIKN